MNYNTTILTLWKWKRKFSKEIEKLKEKCKKEYKTQKKIV